MTARNRLRLGMLALAVLLGSPLLPWLVGRLPPPHEMAERWVWIRRAPLGALAAVLPGLSPFLAAGGLLGGWAAPIWWPLALAVALLAFIKGRWFCWHLCPTGFLTELAGRCHRGCAPSLKRVPAMGRWLLWAALGGAALGYPLFIWLDPLSILSGALNAAGVPREGPALWLAAGLPLVLALCALWPGLWCHRLCPLGALQEDLGRLRRALRRQKTGVPSAPPAAADPPAPPPAPAMDRRSFLALGGGVAAGAAMRWLTPPGVRSEADFIRPPGAAPEDAFKALCARCGNCFRVCPQRIIHAAGGETGWDGLLTPVLRFEPGYCDEHCRECNRVCPTAAIRPLSLDEKRRTAIGTARVDRKTCIAWAEGAYCMVCDEHCPYKAIHGEEQNGVQCPVVDERLCRGCGLCQTVCPGEGPAIRIRGLRDQRRLPA